MSMIGKSLAHYKIRSRIGKGGMGEVYQATDTKLGRDVAIKVLPEVFALAPDRVARFQREGKVTGLPQSFEYSINLWSGEI